VLEQYSNAEFYLKKALEIKEKLQDINVYTLYANLAVVYQKTDRCEDAEKYQLKSIENDKNKLSESYKLKILGIALTYNCLKNTQKEFEYLLTSSNILKKNVFDIATYMSNNEIQQYIQQYFHHRIYPVSFLIRNPIDFKNLNISCFEEELMFKNLLLRNQNRIANSIINSSSNELKANYKKFINNKKQISELNELPKDKRPLFYDALFLETENIEKYLVEQSNEFSKSKNTLSVKWDKLRGKLKSDEVVIDIVDFVYYDTKRKPDSIVYAAFVVGKDNKSPKFISLFEEKELAFLLDRNNNQKDIKRIDKQYTNSAISDLFLKPLEKEFQGITTIYLSPSGLGHQIDFSALPMSETQTFGEKYKLHILSSPAEIVNYKTASLDKNLNLELLLYGGIDYNKSNSIDKIKSERIAPNTIISDLVTRSGIKEYGYLNGTNDEVEQIKLKAKQNGFKTNVLKEREATEESIKQLDGRTTPFVLHLATHGFFFPDPKQELPKDFSFEEGKSKIYKASDNPMMRSGLILAGANKYWGKPFENLTKEDGILTASEISNLDLSACQLVVLSACETGLGEIKGSEGVFGLQRAFKMAGVKNIIMSLWKVPDTQTAELFDIFYGECFAGKTIHEAFQMAQAKMKAKYSPYYWAGFVLLE
jgi:CHAT domain-containing protein